MKATLDRIEQHLQSLIESRMIRLFSGSGPTGELLHKLVSEMGAQVQVTQDGRRLAPNHFLIGLHPDAARELKNDRVRLGQLADALKTAANEAGFLFILPPTIVVSEHPGLQSGGVHIQSEFHTKPLDETRAVTSASRVDRPSGPQGAFLIVDGGGIYPLVHPVINIGRRLDNHLVIDDPRVSRLHAQLRTVHGQYMIFDLGSTGGTFVNEQRVHQRLLYPGDVISLAGVMLVYGQESSGSEPESPGGTRPLSPDRLDSRGG